ncbi:ABC transporter substrate-binding protein [Brevibacillus humidisoli]|uniref:ABC transporter substrate-binding protein n=1 Tax=Brevibacillus humidisoli TaxID=2895522 RepID=UPI001E56E4D2|nr:ABC transporter substrate-binding protein [Brevibacillus humidisoli]UFJ39817.1 ABC transporter substrate-binding protein [Brevibacillus humidisoli]
MRQRNKMIYTWKQKIWVAMLCLLGSALAACSQGEQAVTNGTAAVSGQQTEETEVTLTNMGRTITYSAPPQRAVALNQHATEVMLALGLQDVMVGTAYLDDQILPEYQEAYEQVPVLADEYPSKEVFLAANPDFAYAGWKSAFTEKQLGTVEELAEMGIKTYIQESSNITAPTVEDVYEDIRNIGRIFRVEERADQLIDQMKREMEAITRQLGPVEQPLRVFVYDSGEDKPYTAANNYMTPLIELAGGKNIFDDIEKGWAEVSWEEVVARRPDVIVIMDYGKKTVQQKRDLLLARKGLSEVPAIQNKRFIVLPLSAAAEGIRAPIALETLARGFYPERFEQ